MDSNPIPERWARLEEIENTTSALYKEREIPEAQLLDPYIGKYFKFEAGTGGSEADVHPRRVAIYFYAALRTDKTLIGPMVELKQGISDREPELEAKAVGRIFLKPKNCVEITADEFTRLIHTALDQSLIPSERFMRDKMARSEVG